MHFPHTVNKVASFKRSMSLQVSNPADQAVRRAPDSKAACQWMGLRGS